MATRKLEAEIVSSPAYKKMGDDQKIEVYSNYLEFEWGKMPVKDFKDFLAAKDIIIKAWAAPQN